MLDRLFEQFLPAARLAIESEPPLEAPLHRLLLASRIHLRDNEENHLARKISPMPVVFALFSIDFVAFSLMSAHSPWR